MFDYSQELSRDVQELGVEDWDSANVHDISYGNPNGAQVSAYLVVPHKEGQFAGVIFLHGGEQDRSAFLEEALSLARIGAVSLLIDEPSVRALPLLEPEVDLERYGKKTLKLLRRSGATICIKKRTPRGKRHEVICLAAFPVDDSGLFTGISHHR